MAIVNWLRREVNRRRVASADRARLDDAVEQVIKAVDPRLRAVAGYRRKLAPAIMETARFAHRCVDSLPSPIAVARDRWGTDPWLRACFASVDAMQEVFDGSEVLREFLTGEEGWGASEIFAGIGMRMDRSTRLGHALHGDVVQREVKQSVITFGDYRVGVVAATEEAFKAKLRRRVFEELATHAMQRIVGLHARKEALSEERAALRWKLKLYQRRAQGLGTLWHDSDTYQRHIEELGQRIVETESGLRELLGSAGDIEDFLRLTVEVFGRAAELIRIEPVRLYLDHMNVEHEGPGAGVVAVDLTQVRFGRRRPRIIQAVRFAPDFARVDLGPELRRAARALAV